MKKNWEILNFEECLDKVKNTPKIPQKKFLSEGKFPIISQKENFINGYWNNQNDVLEVTKPVVIFGDHTKIVKFIDFNFVKGADGIKVFGSSHFFPLCIAQNTVSLRTSRPTVIIMCLLNLIRQ